MPLAAIRDENLDRRLDRLDPLLDFVLPSATWVEGVTVVAWRSVPGHTCQVQSTDSMLQSFEDLSTALAADQGEFSMTYIDPTAPTVPTRCYRVRVVDP